MLGEPVHSGQENAVLTNITLNKCYHYLVRIVLLHCDKYTNKSRLNDETRSLEQPTSMGSVRYGIHNFLIPALINEIINAACPS